QLLPNRVRGQVWEGYLHTGDRIGRGQWHSIAGLVMPGLEVRRLGGPDADQDSQHLNVARPQRQRRIETAAALFDGRKMEARGIRNCLQKLRMLHIEVSPWYCRVLADCQIGHRLFEFEIGIQVRIVTGIAVPRPPTRVNRELHEVSYPFSA